MATIYLEKKKEGKGEIRHLIILPIRPYIKGKLASEWEMEIYNPRPLPPPRPAPPRPDRVNTLPLTKADPNLL